MTHVSHPQAEVPPATASNAARIRRGRAVVPPVRLAPGAPLALALGLLLL